MHLVNPVAIEVGLPLAFSALTTLDMFYRVHLVDPDNPVLSKFCFAKPEPIHRDT